ncbi:SulP family inorganic anion transporter [Gordonia sp. HY285]|uniref:SulP family inorganic anion transporter n=1 Tax=Gordonia liuliyuniae TaxID=2911517 RepID=UPI001F189350|nr:SulP family inorganic anion transporter [Gordonia liuliyuniae]MCF8611056.1 SulP family inorganic anion transporter [Gordonia liuliyuniae]
MQAPASRLVDGPVITALRSPRLLTRETLAGVVTALALIPEAISFSIAAGVDPRMGLFASFTMAVSISIVGGRPAMISGAAGSTALVIAPVVRDHGIDYLLATVILAGVLQIVFSVCGVAKLMRFIPRSVMVGFVNALAILIFSAQVQHMLNVPWMVYPMIAAGLAIIVGLPRLTTVVPSPLIAIIVLTAVAMAFGVGVPTVGDEGELPSSLPQWLIPDVPFDLQTLQIIAPYAVGMALVGLLESLMTAKLVDDITDTHSNKTREAWGQGVANVVTGFFGGIGGCAMIGQTMVNVKTAGARTRISTFLTGVALLVLVVGLGDIVGQIPMAALVAVMIMVSATTFNWHSIRLSTLRRMPKSETAVMVIAVVATVVTSNLAIGVISGVVVATLLFVRRVAHFTEVTHADSVHDGHTVRTYHVRGELFFASSNDLVYQFDYVDDPERIVIDLADTHVWDASTVAALDAIEAKYHAKGKQVEIVGLNQPSAERRDRLSGQLGEG